MEEIIQKRADEMKAIQYEVKLLKTNISILEKNISDITKEIKIGQNTKIEEVVQLVFSMLDKSKQSVESIEAEYEGNTTSQCDQCSHRCENEDMLITHTNKKHEESYSCSLCNEYFGT